MEYKEYRFFSIYHSSRCGWPWPPHSDAHDPVEWVFEIWGFDRERWRKNSHSLFDDYALTHNNLKRIKIEVTSEGDGAFAIVDIDTRWRHKVAEDDFHWKGRICKIYTKMPNGD